MKAPRALWKHACFLTDILPLDGIHKKERSYEQRFPMTYPEKFQGIAVVGDREWKNPKKISYEPKPFYPEDVEIKVEACGVCGSDIHCVAGHWGPRNDPLVAGHEIVGRIVRVGRRCSSQLKIGMRVGMGAIAFSCLKCSRCKKGEENYCPKMLLAYNYMYDDGYVSQGGYASHVRVDGRFVVPIPDGIPSYLAAPLMCGGITAYAPLLRHGCGPGKKVGIAGIGGIGHMGITFAKFMGAEVYAFSRRSSKKKDAMKMGADYFIATLEEQNDWAEELFDTLDILLICTNSFSELDLDKLIKIMKKGGSIVTIAEPPKEEMLVLKPFGLLGISLESSSVGTFEEIKQLLQLVSDNNLKIWVEKYPVSEKGVAAAFDRMDKGEARYRIALVDYEKEFPI